MKKSFIDDFNAYLDTNPGPELWKTFTAIGLVAALLERRVWLPFSGGKTWPNMFVFIVGRAGSGKSRIISRAYDLVTDYNSRKYNSKKIMLCSDKVNGATFIEELIQSRNPIDNQSSLFLLQEEMGVSFQDFGAVTFLTDLLKFYDCPAYFSKRIRNLHEEIYNVSVSILAGTTKTFLQRYLPSESRGEGLVSRGLFINVPELEPEEVFKRKRQSSEESSVFLHERIITRNIPKILSLRGPMKETEEAFDFMDSLATTYGQEQKSVAEGSVMDNYLSRKSMQVIKIGMVLAASEYSMLVEKRHYVAADKWLTMAEPFMNEIFAAQDFKWVRGGMHLILDNIPRGKHNALTIPELLAKLATSSEAIPDNVDEIRRRLGALFESGSIKIEQNQLGQIIKVWK